MGIFIFETDKKHRIATNERQFEIVEYVKHSPKLDYGLTIQEHVWALSHVHAVSKKIVVPMN
jgi:hypothetical protein